MFDIFKIVFTDENFLSAFSQTIIIIALGFFFMRKGIIDVSDLSSIINFIHQGDFYLQGTSSSGLTFQFKDLKWTRDSKIYNLLIQPQINFKNSIPSINWLPIITYDENHFSSGDLSMIRKENRFYEKE